jgi:hypothetical protein
LNCSAALRDRKIIGVVGVTRRRSMVVSRLSSVFLPAILTVTDRSFCGNTSELFSFDDNSWLYADPSGKRIIADAEGPGKFVVANPAGEILSQDSFGDYLALPHPATPSSGYVIVQATSDDQLFSSSEDRFPCWIEAGSVLTEFDGRPWPPIPIPFRLIAWHSVTLVSGSSRAIAYQLQEVLSLNVTNETSRKEASFQSQNETDLLEGIGEPGEFSRSYLNALSVRIAIPKGAIGIRLRKTYDAFHGLQRARVLINDAFVGVWSSMPQNRIQRKQTSTFGFPIPDEWSDQTVELRIDPPAGVPLWSLQNLQVFAVIPA